MAWSFVKQPNGRLARFSDVVDNFTHMDLTVKEATQICMHEHGMTEKDAFEKIQRGLDDEPYATDPNETRWETCIATIYKIHGLTMVDVVTARATAEITPVADQQPKEF